METHTIGIDVGKTVRNRSEYAKKQSNLNEGHHWR